ncbi:MAG: hypothetical protein ACLFSW_04680 [Halobacteriales archaeon]
MAIRTDEDVWQETETGPGARERIVEFLEQNRGKAFSAMEIHDHAFDTPTPDPDDDPSSYSAIITQMTIHLAALSYLGKVEGKPLPNDELPNDHDGGHTAYYTAATDENGEEGEDGDENEG